MISEVKEDSYKADLKIQKKKQKDSLKAVFKEAFQDYSSSSEEEGTIHNTSSIWCHQCGSNGSERQKTLLKMQGKHNQQEEQASIKATNIQLERTREVP